MSETVEEQKKKLDEIERNYNQFLELLQKIAEEKGDAASEDPEYSKYYEEASKLNAQFEALQSKIAEMEAAIAAAVPQAAPVEAEAPSVPASDITAPIEAQFDAGDAAQGQFAPSPAGNAIDAQAPAESAQAPAGEVVAPAPEVSTPAVEAPPAPKYITVERTRVEYEKIHEQSWNFVGCASSVTTAVTDLAGKGGYISENVLEKKFGKMTILCPFEVDFPIGGIISLYIKRNGPNVGLIYYPQSAPTPQTSAVLTQLLQQFLASSAPRGHFVVYLKINKSEVTDDKVSIIVGGLTEQEGKIQQNLSKKLGNVFFDNNIFYKGQLLDDVKAIAGKLGLRLVTLVCTSNVIQSTDKLQNLVESF